jgi:hypothetical protein
MVQSKSGRLLHEEVASLLPVLWFGKLVESERFRRLGRGGSFIRATFLGLLLVIGVLVAGCGGGSTPESRELRLGNIGWN